MENSMGNQGMGQGQFGGNPQEMFQPYMMDPNLLMYMNQNMGYGGMGQQSGNIDYSQMQMFGNVDPNSLNLNNNMPQFMPNDPNSGFYPNNMYNPNANEGNNN